MSQKEFNVWCAYRNKFGPFNPVRMYDQGNALVAHMVHTVNGGKSTPQDFMPYGKVKEKDEEIVEPDKFISLLALSKNAKKGR